MALHTDSRFRPACHRAARRLAFLCLMAFLVPRCGVGESIPMAISMGLDQPAETGLVANVTFPGDRAFYVHAPTSSAWVTVSGLEFDVLLPADAPTNVQAMVHVKDWDYFWYQTLLPGTVKPGEWNHFLADFSPASAGWVARGHHGQWHLRSRIEPKEVGIHIFSSTPFEGTCQVGRVAGLVSVDETPPFVRNVLANRSSVPCYEKLELTFEAPDRYPNPFDPEQVTVTGEFEDPEGTRTVVSGYYGQHYYREVTAVGDRMTPQGRPYWRIRFAPLKPGTHHYTIRIRDAFGAGQWGPETFEATPPRLPGFVRVSQKDPRYFEFSDGSYYFPIGHNIRSPSDTRLETVFPWTYRATEGSTAYLRYFKDMSAHGENLAEIWNSAWSLGIEWTPVRPGYHGVGQYNMIHAWEMDRVLEAAEADDIRINYVINNHGKFSTLSDPEWTNNPYSVQNGGYLSTPEEFFSDPRAIKDFLNSMRYMISRWGYSRNIFAWELWSELDLTGSIKDADPKNYRRPEVVEWHRRVGRAVKEMDPWRHMVSTHVCGDYTRQNPDIISLPEMDLCPIDAYHGNRDPFHIVELMKRSAEYNNPFRKPVLITEFGGASSGEGLLHMDQTLHAALWASTSVPLGGTPLFWWWGLIEEEHFYDKYAGVSRFMQGEDRRDPDLVPGYPGIMRGAESAPSVSVVALISPRRALGWVYSRREPWNLDSERDEPQTNLTLRIDTLTNALFRIEFWDTAAGSCMNRQTVIVKDGLFECAIPAFTRDVAFKIELSPDESRERALSDK